MTDPVTIHHVYVNRGYDGTDLAASYTGGDEPLLAAKRLAVALVEKAADRGYAESVYIETHQSGPDGRMEMVDRWDAPSVPRKPELPREYVIALERYEQRKAELERVKAELDPVARAGDLDPVDVSEADFDRAVSRYYEPEPEPDEIARAIAEDNAIAAREERIVAATSDSDLQPGWFNTLFMNLPRERHGYGVMRESMTLDDGFNLSIQASESHYSEPRDNTGPYTAYEVGYPDEHFEALRPYADGRFPSDVYGWVPSDVIEALFEERGWSRYHQYLPQPKPGPKPAPNPEGQLASRLKPHPELSPDYAHGKYAPAQFDVLFGRTITTIDVDGKDIAEGERREDDGDRYASAEVVRFTLSDGAVYRMHHHEDCCEHVSLHDISGSLHDLIGQQLALAEEVSSFDDPPEYAESHTWTFYKLATIKGYVTLRWLGTSNGYYSEGVAFERIE
jgi:hypothetical protein